MRKQWKKFGVHALVMSAFALILAGCGGDEEAESVAEESSAPSMIQRSAPKPAERQPTAIISESEEDFRVMPRLEGAAEEEGLGLETIIDASSKQAYADSLRWIAQDTTKQQFAELERSIRFIHMYDPSILGQESRMLQTIDGMTGAEIIARAQEINRRRRGN